MSHRRKESDVTACNPPNKFQSFLESIKIHLRLSHVKFQQFWYFADRPTKMSIAKRFLRTKQILILITSCLFIFGTIWFGSHPDVSPVTLREHRLVLVMPTVPMLPFDDRVSLIRRLGLQEESPYVNETLENEDMQPYKHVPWELDLPAYANKNAPAIVTAIFRREDYETSLQLISTVNEFASEYHLAIFDMVPADKKEKNKHSDLLNTNETVAIYCNKTEVCSINNTPLLEEWVPKYVRHKDMGAYKAILIQKMLKHFPMVLWLDSDGLVPVDGLEGLWNRTNEHSITTWELSSHCAVSTFTFPKMMPYFGLTANDLNYVTMIESGSYAFKQTPHVSHLLSLWLNCSLTENCIKPIGCDSPDCPGATCIHNHPKTAYLRCHKYETSALSASIVRLGFPETAASYKDYILDAKIQKDAAENGYNKTSVKSTILNERSRLRRLSKRRKVNYLSDFHE